MNKWEWDEEKADEFKEKKNEEENDCAQSENPLLYIYIRIWWCTDDIKYDQEDSEIYTAQFNIEWGLTTKFLRPYS